MSKLTEEQVLQAHEEYVNQRRSLKECSMRKWTSASNIAGAELAALHAVNPTKAENMALSLQFQESYMKRNPKMFNEAVISTNFGADVTPENLLRAVYIGNRNSVRGDIFHEFPLQTFDDAIWYVETTREQALRNSTAGEKLYETTNMDYPGETNNASLGTGNGATLTFSATVTPNPIVPFKTSITVGGAQVAIDDGAGNLVGSTLDSSGTNTVNYTTGAITVTFSAGNAPASGVGVSAFYNWNSENSTLYDQYGTIGIGLRKVRFHARPMPVGWRISDFNIAMFDANGLGDAMGYLEKSVGDAHAEAKDQRAIRLARQIALGNPQEVWDADFAKAGETSYERYAQLLEQKISDVEGSIFNDIKRGRLNKIVAGTKWCSYASMHKTFEYANDGSTKQGIHKFGTLMGRDIYKCPSDSSLVANNEAILTYKNEEVSQDVALGFGTFADISAQLQYPEMYRQGNVAVIEDQKVINSKFCRLLRIDNLIVG